jgi:hypothetical protein
LEQAPFLSALSGLTPSHRQIHATADRAQPSPRATHACIIVVTLAGQAMSVADS